MDSEFSPIDSPVKWYDCNCSSFRMKRSFSGACLRSSRGKYDACEEEGLVVPQNARVDVGKESAALLEAVNSQQQTIQDLINELEVERDASSSAANEAMSMILRLQRDKAEIEMEARQFKRFVEEKMAHEQQEILELEDMLSKSEQVIEALASELQVYKHRMMSYGLTVAEADGISLNDNNSEAEFPHEIYPSLRCNSNGFLAYPNDADETDDIEKYAFGGTPHSSRGQFNEPEYQINQLVKSTRTVQTAAEIVGTRNMLEKAIVGQSPRTPVNLRKISTGCKVGEEIDPNFTRDSPSSASSFRKTVFSYIEEDPNSRKLDNISEVGDDYFDRTYTIDSVYQRASNYASTDPKASISITNCMETPREMLNHYDSRDIEIQKLYARLNALETDRESMRQAIVSIGSDKAQAVLLKEIAQNLCKEMSPPRKPTRKWSSIGSFCFVSIFKWIIPLIFWRKKEHRSRYTFGLSAKNVGLLLLVDPRAALKMHFLFQHVRPVRSCLDAPGRSS